MDLGFLYKNFGLKPDESLDFSDLYLIFARIGKVVEQDIDTKIQRTLQK